MKNKLGDYKRISFFIMADESMTKQFCIFTQYSYKDTTALLLVIFFIECICYLLSLIGVTCCIYHSRCSLASAPMLPRHKPAVMFWPGPALGPHRLLISAYLRPEQWRDSWNWYKRENSRLLMTSIEYNFIFWQCSVSSQCFCDMFHWCCPR